MTMPEGLRGDGNAGDVVNWGQGCSGASKRPSEDSEQSSPELVEPPERAKGVLSVVSRAATTTAWTFDSCFTIGGLGVNGNLTHVHFVASERLIATT